MIRQSALSDEYKKARAAGQPDVVRVLRRLLVGGLTARQRITLNLLPLNGTVTTRHVADRLSIKINHANNLLKHLEGLGLAESHRVVDDKGVFLQWTIVNERLSIEKNAVDLYYDKHPLGRADI